MGVPTVTDTYSSLFYHIVFSTKDRVPWIHSGVEQRLWQYLGGIARKNRMTAIQIGGTLDHLHALVLAPPVLSPSRIAQCLKGDSSRWIHQEWKNFRAFAWQDGYGAFTISKSDIINLIQYIQNQREHHRIKSFQEEYLELLKAYGIQYDKKYIWG